MDHAFGTSDGFTVGIEEELLLVDPGSHALAQASAEVLERLEVDRSAARHDIYAAQIELSSPPSRTVGDAAAVLAALRRRVHEVGGGLMGSGLHPDADFGDVEVVEAERYRREKDRLGGVLLRTPDCALHVHVAMPSFEVAIRAFNGVREWLPLLHALAANSPFWHGQDARLASARTVLRRGFPRVELPPAFQGEDDWRRAVDELCRAAEVEDYTFIWWDVRPHPKLGTLEIRVMDAQAPLWRAEALSAVAHGLAMHEAEAPPREYASRDVLSESLYRATRNGIHTTLWSDGALRPVEELARRATELARPRLRELGDDRALDGVERILADGSGADVQRAWHAEGGMPHLLAQLADATRG
ncbi:MAG: YbdK family carboxylate-amine ligase [Thermoleophilaceae bacterium]